MICVKRKDKNPQWISGYMRSIVTLFQCDLLQHMAAARQTIKILIYGVTESQSLNQSEHLKFSISKVSLVVHSSHVLIPCFSQTKLILSTCYSCIHWHTIEYLEGDCHRFQCRTKIRWVAENHTHRKFLTILESVVLLHLQLLQLLIFKSNAL